MIQNPKKPPIICSNRALTKLISVVVAIKEVVFVILYSIAPITEGILTKMIDK